MNTRERAIYSLCERCGHVWTIHRDTNQIINHVTPLKDRTQRKP
jgi:hypothetical protein